MISVKPLTLTIFRIQHIIHHPQSEVNIPWWITNPYLIHNVPSRIVIQSNPRAGCSVSLTKHAKKTYYPKVNQSISPPFYVTAQAFLSLCLKCIQASLTANVFFFLFIREHCFSFTAVSMCFICSRSKSGSSCSAGS